MQMRITKKYRVTIRQYTDLVIEVYARNTKDAEAIANDCYANNRRHLFDETDKGWSTTATKVAPRPEHSNE